MQYWLLAVAIVCAPVMYVAALALVEWWRWRRAAKMVAPPIPPFPTAALRGIAEDAQVIVRAIRKRYEHGDSWKD